MCKNCNCNSNRSEDILPLVSKDVNQIKNQLGNLEDNIEEIIGEIALDAQLSPARAQNIFNK